MCLITLTMLLIEVLYRISSRFEVSIASGKEKSMAFIFIALELELSNEFFLNDFRVKEESDLICLVWR